MLKTEAEHRDKKDKRMLTILEAMGGLKEVGREEGQNDLGTLRPKD